MEGKRLNQNGDSRDGDKVMEIRSVYDVEGDMR